MDSRLCRREELDQVLLAEIDDMDAQTRRWWDLIRIEPEQWINKASSYRDVHFWAIGILGKRVLWFQHVERDWCLSPFETYGYIIHSHTDCVDLPNEIHRLIAFVKGDESWRAWLQLS